MLSQLLNCGFNPKLHEIKSTKSLPKKSKSVLVNELNGRLIQKLLKYKNIYQWREKFQDLDVQMVRSRELSEQSRHREHKRRLERSRAILPHLVLS